MRTTQNLGLMIIRLLRAQVLPHKKNLKASKLVFISDVPFVKDQHNARISVINGQIAQDLVAKDIIKDGMIVKVENALDAVNRGVDKVHIISGEIDDALLTELETEDGIGTVFQSKDLDY